MDCSCKKPFRESGGQTYGGGMEVWPRMSLTLNKLSFSPFSSAQAVSGRGDISGAGWMVQDSNQSENQMDTTLCFWFLKAIENGKVPGTSALPPSLPTSTCTGENHLCSLPRPMSRVQANHFIVTAGGSGGRVRPWAEYLTGRTRTGQRFVGE